MGSRASFVIVTKRRAKSWYGHNLAPGILDWVAKGPAGCEKLIRKEATPEPSLDGDEGGILLDKERKVALVYAYYDDNWPDQPTGDISGPPGVYVEGLSLHDPAATPAARRSAAALRERVVARFRAELERRAAEAKALDAAITRHYADPTAGSDLDALRWQLVLSAALKLPSGLDKGELDDQRVDAATALWEFSSLYRPEPDRSFAEVGGPYVAAAADRARRPASGDAGATPEAGLPARTPYEIKAAAKVKAFVAARLEAEVRRRAADVKALDEAFLSARTDCGPLGTSMAERAVREQPAKRWESVRWQLLLRETSLVDREVKRAVLWANAADEAYVRAEALVALWLVSGTYDPHRGIKFPMYAMWRVRSAAEMAANAASVRRTRDADD